MLEGLEKRNRTHCWWGTHYYSQYEEQPEDSLPHPTPQKRKRDRTIYDSTISLPGPDPENSIPYRRDICTSMFIVALFTIARK